MKRSVILMLAIALAAAAVGGWALWRWRIAHRTVYTDGQTIKQPLRHALVRDVLWEPPKALPATINSAAQDTQPRLSADGLSLYFVRRELGGNADIYVSTRASTADGNWSDPRPLMDINTPDDETGPAPSADGQSLFFCSNRPGGFGGDDLWVAKRGEFGWQPPVNLGASINTEHDERGPAVSNDRATLYFSSNRPRADMAAAQSRPDQQQRDDDLYIASILNSGEILPAKPLDILNSPFDDRSPAISPAGDFLYFCSDRPGSRGGFDIYRAWLVRGEYMPPTNLGADVNTTADETDPAVCLGGFGLYFSSNRIVDVMIARENAVRRDQNLYYSTSREVFREVEPAGPLVDWASLWAMLGPTLLWLLLGLAGLASLFAIAKRMRSGKLSLLARCLLASLGAHLLIMVLLTFWRVTASITQMVQHGEIKIAISSGGADALAAQVRGELTAVVPASARGELTRAQSDIAMEPSPARFALAAAMTSIPLDRSSVELDPSEAPIPDRPTIAPVTTPSVEASASADVAAPADAMKVAMAEAQPAPPSAQHQQARDRSADVSPPVQIASNSRETIAPQQSPDEPRTDRSLVVSKPVEHTPAAEPAAPKPAVDRFANAPSMTVAVAPPHQPAPQRVAEAQRAVPSALEQPHARDRAAEALPSMQAMHALAARVAPQQIPDASRPDRTLVTTPTVTDSTAALTNTPTMALKNIDEAPAASLIIAAPREGAPQSATEPQPASPAALVGQRLRDRGADAIPTAVAASGSSAKLSPTRQPAVSGNEHSLAAAPPVKDSAGTSSGAITLSLEQFATGAATGVAGIGVPREGAPQKVAEANPGLAMASGSSMKTRADAPIQTGSASAAAALLAPARATAMQQGNAEPSLAGAAAVETSNSPASSAAQASGAASASALAADLPSAVVSDMLAPASRDTAVGAAEADIRIVARSSSPASSGGRGTPTGAMEPARAVNATISPATQPASSSSTGSSLAALSAAVLPSSRTDSQVAAGGRAPVDASLSNLPSTAAPAIGIPASKEAAIAASGEPEGKSAAPSAVTTISGGRSDYVLARQSVREGGISIAPNATAASAARANSSFASVDQRALGNTERDSTISGGNSSTLTSDALSAGIPALATATLAIPQGTTAGGAQPATESSKQGARPMSQMTGRSVNGAVGLIQGEPTKIALAPQSLAAAASGDVQPSSSAAGAPPKDSPIILASASNIVGGSGSDAPDVGLPAIDVRVPTEITPLANPYVARTEDKRMEIVKTMGGSEATERAVSQALKWFAAHQAPDGRWAAKDFDDRCGECGGLAKFDTDIATTGLALLCFLGADHTHMKDGPYRQQIDRGLTWLLQHQKPDGDLRGGETMYSHGIATIAVSESFGMTGDPRLLEPLKNAIEFIGRARNRRTGGWRYEPGQVGDTSVLGWQVMALISAKRAGLAIPNEALDSARQWLEIVSTPVKPGLYAYQPGQRYSPSMTAEGMFVQQLLGMDHEDARMGASAEFVMQNPPRWNNDPNSYYWYYATLALFQYQGDAWKNWNKNITEQLLANQRTSGAAAGSWDPVDNWSKIGGRVYQTAVCTLCLEVYYRYLPMYAAVKTDQAKSNE